MTLEDIPWLDLAVLLPLVGAVIITRLRDPRLARQWGCGICGVSLICAQFAWFLTTTPTDQSVTAFRPGSISELAGREVFELDDLSAPLLPLCGVIHFVTLLVTLRTKLRRFSFVRALLSLTVAMATIACRDPWGIIGLLAAGMIIPFLELKVRHQPTRVFLLHMALCVGLLIIGQHFTDQEDGVGMVDDIGHFVQQGILKKPDGNASRGKGAHLRPESFRPVVSDHGHFVFPFKPQADQAQGDILHSI